MKTFAGIALLLLSLALNAYLVNAISSPASPSVENATKPGKPSASSRAGSDKGVPPGDAAAKSGPLDWSAIAGEDPRALAERLRASGVPDALARIIIGQMLEKKVATRSHELKDALPKMPYWSSTALTPTIFTDPKAVAELRQMRAANLKELTSLYGPAAESDPMAAAEQRTQFGALSQDKIDQIALVNGDYTEMTTAVRATMLGITLPEDTAQLSFLEKSRMEDIRAVLTPDEFQDYLYRSSNTGSSLRSNLALFSPSESEFRAIFDLQYAFDQKFNSGLGSTPAMMDERSAAQAQLAKDIKATLDPSRVADYEKSTDFTYRQAYDLVTRLDLPKPSADAIWATQKDIQQRATAIRTNENLAPEVRNSQLAGLQQEATNKLTPLLGGQRGLDTYKQESGQWIQSLVPPPAAGRGGTP